MKNLNKNEINIVGGGMNVKMIEWFSMRDNNGVEFYQAGCLRNMPIEKCDQGAALFRELLGFDDIPSINGTKTIARNNITIEYHIGLPA